MRSSRSATSKRRSRLKPPRRSSTSAAPASVRSSTNVHELPLQGRQVTDLIMLVGAAVQTGTSDSRSMQGGVSISVAGGLSFGVAYLLDGAMHNNPQNNANLPMPFPDALQEFSVATSGLSAQNGIHSGASVNAVTRSGTNAFHGNAFEFLRDRRFNATDPFARIGRDGKRVDDGLNRHQYGGHARRTDRARPAVLLRRLPGHSTAPAAVSEHRLRADGRDAGRRFHRVRLARVPGADRSRLARRSSATASVPALFSPAALNLVRRLPATTDPCGQITYTTSDDRDEATGGRPRRLPVEPEPFAVRPLHDDGAQEAVAVRAGSRQRADDRHAGARQPGAVGRRGQHASCSATTW